MEPFPSFALAIDHLSDEVGAFADPETGLDFVTLRLRGTGSGDMALRERLRLARFPNAE